MRPDERTLTTEEQAALAAIETTLAHPIADTHDTATIEGIAALLRQGAPQADADYRQRLRERVLDSVPPRGTREEDSTRITGQPTRPRLLTRRRVLAAGIVAAVTAGGALAIPPARAAVAALLGRQTTPPTILPIAIERTTPLPLAIGSKRNGWLGPDDAQREYSMRTIVRERWLPLSRYSQPGPPPGAVVVLASGRALPIPGYLPAGFQWQGLAVSDGGAPNTIPFEYVGAGAGGSASGGGGSGMPWERPLQYDRQVGVYLIGGDPADRMLLFQQFKPEARGTVAISVFQMDVPPQAPPPMPPGRTAPPGFYGERTVFWTLVEPVRDHVGLAVQAGANALQPTTVAGEAAWWFAGTWNADGVWVPDAPWISVVWTRDGYVYCLSGQQLPLAELLRVAESVP